MSIEELKRDITLSLLGIGFILLSIMFAVFGVEYAALPLSFIGIILCIVACSNRKSGQEKETDQDENKSE